MTRAAVLHCPNCGGVAERDSVRCSFCQAQLRTSACGQCFALCFIGSKHCPGCGHKLTEGLTQIDPGGPRPDCPRCKVPLGAVLLSGTLLEECGRCGGLWVEQTIFEAICAQRELGATIRALAGNAAPAELAEPTSPSRATYVPCARCNKLMNRTNFARISGVIIDSCKGHGTWFDRDELRRIVEFIAEGGLDHARARELAKLEEARQRAEVERRLREKTQALNHASSGRWGGATADEEDLLATLGAAIWSLFR